MDATSTPSAIRRLSQQLENGLAGISNDTEERVLQKVHALLNDKVENLSQQINTLRDQDKDHSKDMTQIPELKEAIRTLSETTRSQATKIKYLEERAILNKDWLMLKNDISTYKTGNKELQEEVDALREMVASQQEWIDHVRAAPRGRVTASPP